MTPAVIPCDLAVPGVIKRLGGRKVIAAACGLTDNAVSQWQRAGIPVRHALTLWRLAHEHGLDWRPAGLDWLRPAPPQRAAA
jgi:hypothetical protein